MVDEVRRRVKQKTLGHRARKGDPLFGIRRMLQIGAGHLTAKQAARLDAKLALGDPDHEVTLAWQCYQKLRHIYHTSPARGREPVTEVIASFPACPIPEISRPGRNLKQWKTAILAYFGTFVASNGPTEAINSVIETTRRIARGFRNFTNYRLGCLLVAGGHRPYRIESNKPTAPTCEGKATLAAQTRIRAHARLISSTGGNLHLHCEPDAPSSTCFMFERQRLVPYRSGSRFETLRRPALRRSPTALQQWPSRSFEFLSANYKCPTIQSGSWIAYILWLLVKPSL
ncbi:hypothetical protein BWQ92_04935 [Arthrobacter sp. QXT-31]|nr:hypothetical protein BWQ92_04935 [Arthrobacter sp. QXT-31]